MSIKYIITGDEPPRLGFDDDGGDWYGGLQKCFATLALAAVMAITATQTMVAASQQDLNSNSYPDEIARIRVEEEYWDNPVPPVTYQNEYAQPWNFDPSEVLPALVPDEDFWDNPVFPVIWTAVYRPQYSFEQNDLGWLKFDDDYWSNPVAPIGYQNICPVSWAFDPNDVATLGIDDEFWKNPSAPIVAINIWPQPFLRDPSSDDLPSKSQLDDNYLLPQIVWPSAQWHGSFTDTDEIVLSGFVPDEDYWMNPVHPIIAGMLLSSFVGTIDEAIHVFPPGPTNKWRSARFGFSTPSYR